MKKHLWKAFGFLGLIVLLTASSCDTPNEGRKNSSSNNKTEQASVSASFENILNGQPIPVFTSSVEHDTLSDVLSMRAEGTHGTAVVTSIDGTLLWWCPTEGGPIPSTYQISSDQVFVDPPDKGGQTDVLIPQGEPTGVYPGDSDATWVKCLDDNGNPFVVYDEAQVRWFSGEVDGLPVDKRARVDEITFEFTETEGTD